MDNVLLGRTFRKKFTDGFRRLVRAGKLRLEEEWARLLDCGQLEAWLTEVTQPDWNVFIEGPPRGKSNPQQVLKYLARYMAGGPIADRRMIRDENGHVTFWARSESNCDAPPVAGISRTIPCLAKRPRRSPIVAFPILLAVTTTSCLKRRFAIGNLRSGSRC